MFARSFENLASLFQFHRLIQIWSEFPLAQPIIIIRVGYKLTFRQFIDPFEWNHIDINGNKHDCISENEFLFCFDSIIHE